jgi:hypothetical protein
MAEKLKANGWLLRAQSAVKPKGRSSGAREKIASWSRGMRHHAEFSPAIAFE